MRQYGARSAVVAHNIWAVTDDSLTARAVPSGHGRLGFCHARSHWFGYRQRFLARDSCGQDVAAVTSVLHAGRDAGSGWSGTGEARTVIGMNLESGGQFGDYQNEIYLGGLSGVLPTMPMAFDVLEARAQATLLPSVLSYVAGGAGDESTQRANVSAFLQWGLVPRMMVGDLARLVGGPIRDEAAFSVVHGSGRGPRASFRFIPRPTGH